ncbi:hypothetical protein [Ruegeria atlantica]|uniref:hypothetical protein n=1 Tax=Ruegeria atlantica TaxID=81569 RepID=UPI00249507F0|nr:hypothetical protein [Ruegeria atlantica]
MEPDTHEIKSETDFALIVVHIQINAKLHEGRFFSITVYREHGYIDTENAMLNKYNIAFYDDDTFTGSIGDTVSNIETHSERFHVILTLRTFESNHGSTFNWLTPVATQALIATKVNGQKFATES